MKKSIFLIFCFFLSFHLTGQVNFSEHIAPIIYDNCTSCHRDGEIGPMKFTNYQEVKNWASTIAYTTEIKYMPPWQPNQNFSHFVGERGLTDNEIKLIADWVEAGTPQGDPALEPPLPYFPSGSQLGTPDLVLTMDQSYTVVGNNTDDYRVFVLPSGLATDKEIAAVEFRPGNRKAVHHALIAYDTNGEARAKDAEAEGYGYPSFGDFGIQTEGSFTGYTPGIQSVKYPPGVGKMLPANADVLIQVHYAPLPTDETDKSTVNIFFKEATDKIERPLKSFPFTPFDILEEDGAHRNFFFLANTKKEIRGAKEVTKDMSLISVYPHCHYLGQSWKIFAVTPNADTINIIEIPEWDFNWQGAYTFDRMKKIPEGSVIYANALYDNTTDNPFNPSNPPVFSTWGEGTTDEMFLVGLNYVDYQEGDEAVIIGADFSTSVNNESVSTKNILYPPFPNPAKEELSFNFYLDQPQAISIAVYDMAGKEVKKIIATQFTAGNHRQTIDVGTMSGGAYLITMRGENFVLSENLLIVDK